MTYPKPQPLPFGKITIWIIMVVIFLWVIKQSPGAEPPPWCVQIDVKDGYGSSHGSGSLVSPSLVLTNWHVVKDRKSDSVNVWFPDGSNVSGKVIKTDKTNDIAAIRIQSSLRPYITLSDIDLKIGDTLTLHGYAGKHNYRSATGVVGQFESPTRAGPNNFLRLDGVEARGGDSGGPLTCDDGTLGGVLFGSSGGRTSGVRISTVRKFVDEVAQ